MSYHHTDPRRESDPTALPDVEVWHDDATACDRCDASMPGSPSDVVRCVECRSASLRLDGDGWWYASGFPGCLHDSDPCGPFDTAEAALSDARDGLDVCPECDGSGEVCVTRYGSGRAHLVDETCEWCGGEGLA